MSATMINGTDNTPDNIPDGLLPINFTKDNVKEILFKLNNNINFVSKNSSPLPSGITVEKVAALHAVQDPNVLYVIVPSV